MSHNYFLPVDQGCLRTRKKKKWLELCVLKKSGKREVFVFVFNSLFVFIFGCVGSSFLCAGFL